MLYLAVCFCFFLFFFFGIFDYYSPAFTLQNMSAHACAQIIFSTIMHFNNVNNIRKFSCALLSADTKFYTFLKRNVRFVELFELS